MTKLQSIDTLSNIFANDAPAPIQSSLGYGEAPDLLSNNEVYDEGDQAQWIQLSEMAAIREKAQKINAPESHPDFDGVHCVECEVDIPTARLAWGKVRCVDCQKDLEVYRKQHSSN